MPRRYYDGTRVSSQRGRCPQIPRRMNSDGNRLETVTEPVSDGFSVIIASGSPGISENIRVKYQNQKNQIFLLTRGGWLIYNRYSVWVSVRLICRFWDAGAFTSGGGCDCQESLVLPNGEFPMDTQPIPVSAQQRRQGALS